MQELAGGSEAQSGILGPREPLLSMVPGKDRVPGQGNSRSSGCFPTTGKDIAPPLAPLPRIGLWDFCFLSQSPKGEGVTCFAGEVTGSRELWDSRDSARRGWWVTPVMST